MRIIKSIFILMVIFSVMNSCTKSDDTERKEKEIKVAHVLADLSIAGSETGIINIPDNVPDVIRNIFNRYTRVMAPNGKPIHILAQAKWTDDQILKARNVLEYLLTDSPGSLYGNNKDDVANSMADRNASMVLFNDVDALEKAFGSTDLRRVDLSAQDLRANECPAEGDDDYMNHITRDASYEEIWHLVHDNGIKKVRPGMIADMRKANDIVAGKGGWRAYPDDEPQEHPNEYVSVLIDNYFDLWKVRPKKYEGRDIGPKQVPDGTSHFGRYYANSRKKLKTLDPDGLKVIQNFFMPYLTYEVELPVQFEGTFSIEFNKDLIYTHKSQHLKDVTLRGKNSSKLIGNSLNNRLTGNGGDNIITGNSGNDIIDGNDGSDTAVFSGVQNEYDIKYTDGRLTISDKIEDRDGEDVLLNCEFIQFRDKKLAVKELKPEKVSAVSMSSSQIIYLSGTREDRDIYIMNPDGSGKMKYISPGFSVDWPSWSHDGKQILFVSYEPEHRGLYVSDKDGSNVRKINTEAKNVDVVCWSNDGNEVAFMTEDARGITIADISGKTLRSVAGGTTSGAYHQWSPVSDELIFESGRDGNPEIYSIDIETGKELRRLTESKLLDEWPSFSKDGSIIAWTRGVERNKNIWIMDADGGNQRQLTKNIAVGDSFHSFSPNGKQLVFTSGYEGDKPSIYIINTDGTGMKKIADGSSPNWSPVLN